MLAYFLLRCKKKSESALERKRIAVTGDILPMGTSPNIFSSLNNLASIESKGIPPRLSNAFNERIRRTLIIEKISQRNLAFLDLIVMAILNNRKEMAVSGAMGM